MPSIDKGSLNALTLLRLDQGGYIVADALPSYREDSGVLTRYYFAHHDIEAALQFMRDAIKPVEFSRAPNPPPWDPTKPATVVPYKTEMPLKEES